MAHFGAQLQIFSGVLVESVQHFFCVTYVFRITVDTEQMTTVGDGDLEILFDPLEIGAVLSAKTCQSLVVFGLKAKSQRGIYGLQSGRQLLEF